MFEKKLSRRDINDLYYGGFEENKHNKRKDNVYMRAKSWDNLLVRKDSYPSFREILQGDTRETTNCTSIFNKKTGYKYITRLFNI